MGISTDDSGMGLSAFHRGVYQVRTGADAGGGSSGGGGGGTTDASLSAHISASDPHPQYIKVSQKGAPNGVAALGADGLLPLANLPPAIASDAALAASLAAHVDPLTDPHPQYITAAKLAAALAGQRGRSYFISQI